jgi:hypothetical protein
MAEQRFRNLYRFCRARGYSRRRSFIAAFKQWGFEV